ncbi:hypothetical protein CC2G_010312 [Coprinopsis cinerea AmutBmut pab1-1]|nr:hypothetical protein CC2G_010312 [Coprinopsis cinerea AmutBmut pab1-1]
MPYVDLYSRNDYASIYYTTSAPFNNVGGFDPDKPTILILHPMLLDSTWLQNQFGDPRLYNNYNLIAIDMRSSGESTCTPSGKRDSWVDAADIALCHQTLNLPPCHVFALEAISVNCALRFAILFPEMCRSLALCNIPSPIEQRWSYSALEELVRSWSFAEDLEGLEHAGTEALAFLLGPNSDPDLQDEIFAHWQKTAPPMRRPWLIETANLLLNRTSLTPEMHAQITQPVLIIHGERNEFCSRKDAEVLAAQLTNAEGGAVIYTVKGAGSFLSIIPGSASIANQALVKFLSRLPPSRSDILPLQQPIWQRMQLALQLQAELVQTKKLSSSMDPVSSLSFSCLSEDVVEKQTAIIEEFRRGRFLALNPMAPHGKPYRK